MPAPSAVFVLRLHKPISGEAHGCSVFAEFQFGCDQSKQNLTGIEGDRNHRYRIYFSTLETAAGKLDLDQPISHSTRTRAQISPAIAFGVLQKSRNDVAGG